MEKVTREQSHSRSIRWRLLYNNPPREPHQRALDLIADVRVFFQVPLRDFCFLSVRLGLWCFRTGIILLSPGRVVVLHTMLLCCWCVISAVSWCGPPALWQGTCKSFLRPSQGDGCHSEGPGQGLMSAFYIQGGEERATGVLCEHSILWISSFMLTYSDTHATLCCSK